MNRLRESYIFRLLYKFVSSPSTSKLNHYAKKYDVGTISSYSYSYTAYIGDMISFKLMQHGSNAHDGSYHWFLLCPLDIVSTGCNKNFEFEFEYTDTKFREIEICIIMSSWHENCSAVLAICEGNRDPPVTRGLAPHKPSNAELWCILAYLNNQFN